MYEYIREPILRNITAKDYEAVGFTLTCSEETLAGRRKKRGDKGEISFEWLSLPPYPHDYVINTDDKSVREIVAEICGIIDGTDK